MNQVEYLRESARTVSDAFHPEVISPQDGLQQLAQLERLSKLIDRVKKGLYYGKPIPTEMVAEVGVVGSAFDQEELHFLIGLWTEVGELSEVLRQQWERPTAEGNQRVADEMGDVRWYMAGLYRTRGLDPDKVDEANIAKLRARFPEKFSSSQAVSRNDASEQKALAGALAKS
jgi:hypothetical protein